MSTNKHIISYEMKLDEMGGREGGNPARKRNHWPGHLENPS
jgi:hypothetical protein